MGKTAGNGIYLVDEPDQIRKKVMRAVTDSGPTKENQEMTEPIRNIFSLMEIVSAEDTVAHFKEQYNTCQIRYGDMKKQLAEDIIKYMAEGPLSLVGMPEQITDDPSTYKRVRPPGDIRRRQCLYAG